MHSYIHKGLSFLAIVLCFAFFAPRAEAQTVGNCVNGKAEKYLDVNNVRARILNVGGLFWNGDPNVYTVPKGGAAEAIFAGGIWLSGITEGDNKLRMAAATYGTWEFWPGPLDANGNPPADCSTYDRIYKVSLTDITTLNETGVATSDLAEWPWQIGAPVKDGDGNPNNYDITKGDRPDMIGDQMIWWVMNDVGNAHKRTSTDPIGVEVQTTAFAFNQAGDLGNMTFYRTKIIYKGKSNLTETMLSLWSDVDLGDSSDDYLGVDTTLSLGYVYNSDENDGGDHGYGAAPPAIGYDFFQGPLVNGKRLGVTYFHYFLNGSPVCGDPAASSTEYRYAQTGRCRDGRRLSATGDGSSGNPPYSNFAFTGDPVTGRGWSEMNNNGAGGRSPNGDRRFVMSTGPWTMKPGEVQEIVYGIVWARAKTALGSLAKLRLADTKAQDLFNNNFVAPNPPDAPNVTVSANDGQIFLNWSWPANSDNYLGSYKETKYAYDLEGYIVKQYATEVDQEGTVIAVYDKNNGIQRIYDVDENDPLASALVVAGSDSGLKTSHIVDGVINYQNTYFGVQAYAYNPAGVPKVLLGIEKRVEFVPTDAQALNGGTKLQAKAGDVVTSTSVGSSTDGYVTATVVDPLAITGDEYQVKFYNHTIGSATYKTYDIINVTKNNTVVFDGKKAVATLGTNAPENVPVTTIDGLQFTVYGAPNGFKSFQVVANAGGPLAVPEMGAFAFNASGFPCLGPAGEADPSCALSGTRDRPAIAVQQKATGAGLGWGIHTADNGSRAAYSAFTARTTRDGASWGKIVPFDFEIRFTAAGGKGVEFNSNNTVMDVPFEIWNIGSGTPANTADDVRMIPSILENGPNGLAAGIAGRVEDKIFNLSAADHTISGGADDPYTDAIYWVNPTDMTPGQGGYNATIANAAAGGVWSSAREVMARMVLVNWNGGTAAPYGREMPEVGTVFRINSTKPNVPGVVHKIATADKKTLTGDAANFSLDRIGITPNPYKGASAFETSNIKDEVRFTDLPDNCTIRVFTLDGTLVRTLSHNSANGYLTWDMANENGLRLASGMYLIHVDVPNVGEKVLKFGVVRKKIQLSAF